MSRPTLYQLLCLFLLAALAFPATARDKDTLVIGITQFPPTLNPNIELMSAKYYILNMTMRPFTTHDADWNLVCLLCTELPTIENGGAVIEKTDDGKQGIAITYTIHPDAKWGDSTPVSTADVEYTIEVGKHPESGVVGAELFRRIRSVDAIDEKTFTLHLDRVEYDYNRFGLYLLPAHIDRPTFAEPREYRNRNAFDTDTYNPGLYFGPYRISKVEPGAYVELVRNDTWWGKEPYFDKIVVRIIENTAALEANLLSGSIDFMSGTLGVTLDQALAIQKRYANDFDYVFRPGLIYEHIDLQLENPILADIRVRKALIHAIDRQAISDQLFEGRQPVADVFVSPLDTVYDPEIVKYAFDPEKAAVLLDEAGWSKMIDGIRHNEANQPLRLEFGTTAGSRVREVVQQVLQAQWGSIGIDVRIRNQPARVFFGDTVTKRLFTGFAMYAWISAPESSPRSTLHSSEIPTEENNWNGSNYVSYRSERMDELIDSVEVELNSEKRMQLWAEIQNMYATELPVIPLYFRSEPFIIPKWLKGVEPTGNSSTTTTWVENWHAAQ